MKNTFHIVSGKLKIITLSALISVNVFTKAQDKTTNAEKLGFPKGKKVLLLHCDDAGMCPESNKGVQNYIESGDILSAAVMMPCPNAEEMVQWVKMHPAADIGVHLTLTSEWKTYRWTTLTNPEKVPGLIDPEGKMWHDVPEVVTHATPKEVETEIHAQIDKMLKMGYKPSHIDTHMGTLYGSAEFAKVFFETAVKYNIPANAIDLSDKEVADFYRAAGYPIDDKMMKVLDGYPLPKLDNFGSVPSGKTYNEIKTRFFALVNSLKPGITEIIFHPAVYSENLKTITGSWNQRNAEAKLFSDSEVKKFFADNGIIVTTWTEVMKMFNSKK